MTLSAPAWERRYARKLILTDIAVVIVATFGAQFARYGFGIEDLDTSAGRLRDLNISYTYLSIVIVIAWLAALSVFETRDPKAIGIGPQEYKRVVSATFVLFGGLAIVAFAFKWQLGRGYLFIALPLGLLLLLVTRWLWRKRLHKQRQRHKNIYRTLIVGERTKSAHVAHEISKNRYAGFGLLGAVTEKGSNRELLPGLPVVASYDGLIDAVDRLEVGTLILTSSDTLTPERVRQIGWQLESRKVDLVVAAALTDIAGPRIHMRPVSGFPLIHVEYPKFEGRKHFTKRMFDIFASGLILILLSPVLLVISVLVKTGSPGPVIFKQPRIGMNGSRFNMFKFRSMVVDAEEQLPGLLDHSEGNGVLFKIKNDPRVTKVGRVLRKFSLDELPQLVNVLRGEMSLVGPRPPLPKEVEEYDEWTHRRLLVKPGITGLWQVSGRSDLSWEDSVRLDLYYVENWSLVGDLVILFRTVKTVVMPDGAY